MKTINVKLIKKDKCHVPRDKLRECVIYLRYGKLVSPSNKSNIWYAKQKIGRMLGIPITEVNRILKDEMSPSR